MISTKRACDWKIRTAVCFAPLVAWILAGASASAAQDPAVEFDVEEVATGVFVARPGSSSGSLIGANAAFIINDDDIVVVDTHMTPGAAEALLETIRRYSRLPVRLVVQTHWHPDHTQGTQAYRAAYPDPVRVLSHRLAREEIETLGLARLERDLERIPKEIELLEARLAARPDASPAKEWRRTLDDQRRFIAELRRVKLVLPEVTFSESVSITGGTRVMQLLYFGRGHTAGDAVVYLPRERVAIVGDLVTGGPPFARDGFPREWIHTLRSLEGLAVDIVISGHGTVRGPEVFAARRAFLESALAVVDAGRREGLSPEAIAERIDIDSFRSGFDPEPPNRPWRGWMLMIVERALLDSE